jgi:hypothetical protein
VNRSVLIYLPNTAIPFFEEKSTVMDELQTGCLSCQGLELNGEAAMMQHSFRLVSLLVLCTAAVFAQKSPSQHHAAHYTLNRKIVVEPRVCMSSQRINNILNTHIDPGQPILNGAH